MVSFVRNLISVDIDAFGLPFFFLPINLIIILLV